MHEYGIAREIVRIAAQAATDAGARRVTGIKLVVGDLASVVDESVQLYFDLLAEETPVAGAKLIFERVPAELICQSCGHRYQLAGRQWRCPLCGGEGHLGEKGREFYVASVDVDD
jgi:hydrogenase nickel incorporation protein HypA/HybF